MPSPIRQAVAAAARFAVVGLATGAVLSFGSTAEHGHWAELPAVTGVAFFMTAFAVWWVHVARGRNTGALRGANAGAVIGLLVHPVTWYLMICWNWMAIMLLRRPPPAVGDPMDPVTGLVGALGFSYMSVIIGGWVTVPAGALIGASVGRSQSRNGTAGEAENRSKKPDVLNG